MFKLLTYLVKFFGAIFFFILCLSVQQSKDINKILKEDGAKMALEYYKGLLRTNPQNKEALSGACLTSARIIQAERSKALKQAYIKICHIYAVSYKRISSSDAWGYYLTALSTGLTAFYAEPTEKVRLANQIIQNINLAISKEPNNSYFHHLRGKYYFEISRLTAFEIKIANMFYGKMPIGNLKMALAEYEIAYKNNSKLIVIASDYALALHKNNQDQKAKQLIMTALKTENTFKEDDLIKAECRALLPHLK